MANPASSLAERQATGEPSTGEPAEAFSDGLGAAGEASRVDEVYHSILGRIVRGELAGGEELNGAQLAKELGVSRTPVVQALARLAADGVISQELNKRAVVRPGAENWLVEVHYLRELLEPPAAELAAARISDDTLAELSELARAASPCEGQAWMHAARRFDYALHLAIADACGKLVLREAIRKCWTYKRLSYEAGADSPAAIAQGYQQHLAIFQALAARDGATAAAAVLYHLRSAAHGRPATRIV